MTKNNKHKSDVKRTWVPPELRIVSGLDTCVDFLYGPGGSGNPIGGDDPPPPPPP